MSAAVLAAATEKAFLEATNKVFLATKTAFLAAANDALTADTTKTNEINANITQFDFYNPVTAINVFISHDTSANAAAAAAAAVPTNNDLKNAAEAAADAAADAANVALNAVNDVVESVMKIKSHLTDENNNVIIALNNTVTLVLYAIDAIIKHDREDNFNDVLDIAMKLALKIAGIIRAISSATDLNLSNIKLLKKNEQELLIHYYDIKIKFQKYVTNDTTSTPDQKKLAKNYIILLNNQI